MKKPKGSSTSLIRRVVPGCSVVMHFGIRGADYGTQVIILPELDEKLRKQCLHLLYKICKAHGMLPTSYIIQPELIHLGEFGWSGGFADVSKGEYRGYPVAIKHLRIGTSDEFKKIFKVCNCAQPGVLQSLT